MHKASCATQIPSLDPDARRSGGHVTTRCSARCKTSRRLKVARVEQIRVAGAGHFERPRMYVAERNRKALPQLAFDPELGLLRVGVLEVGVTAEDHAQGRNGAVVGDVDAEQVFQIILRDASFIPCWRSSAADLSLLEQGLEDGSTPWEGGKDQGNLPEAIHGPGGAIGNGVHNLLIAVIAVHNVQVPHHRVNLIVNRGVENPVPRANYRLVLAKWIPSERNAWGKIIRVGVQGRVALIELVPDTVVESEVGPKGPRILPVASDQRIRIHDQSTAKTLNITLRQAQRGRLQSIHSSSARKTACIGPRWWRHQARAEHLPGQVAKKEPTGKVSVGV